MENIGYVLGLLPCDLADVEQALLSGKDLYECTEIEDGNNLSMVYLADLGDLADAHDPLVGLVHCILVVGSDVHDALSVDLVDVDLCTGLRLDLLDGLATLSDDSTDEVLVDLEGLDARNERLVVLAGLVHALAHLAKDVHAALMSLCQSLFENLVGKTVPLDVHLGSGDTVLGTCNLEVHVSEVVLVAEDIGQDCVAVIGMLLVGDKAHGNSADHLLDGNAGVHEGEAASADGSLGRGTVGLENPSCLSWYRGLR